jgi:hypothetical protein
MTMKSKILSIAILVSFIALAGCEYDNYNPPESTLSGTVVYNGKAVGVRSGGTQLELWQYGYQLRSKIPVNISQDGTFTAKVFDGNYKLVRLAGGPWATQTDSISVTVAGTTTVDVPVTPFYVLTGETFAYTSATKTITGTCTVTKVGTAAITSVTLYVGITNIVDANNNSQSTNLSGSALSDLSTPKTANVVLNTANQARTYVYVRMGVLSAGSSERYYTPVQKITLQ